MPVSSYAAEMLLLFIEASRHEVLIKLNNTKHAVKMRQRLHNLRRDMRKEKHPSTNIANGVTISITPNGDLLAYPADTQHIDAIRKAGIGVKLPNEIAAGNTPANSSSLPMAADGEGDIQDVLQNFFSTTQK